ncbi:ATP-binding protein [Streptomyces macrosporus]
MTRTLGAAVLGVAIAAAGAGTAAAAPLGVDKTAGGLLKPLPVEEVARTLPAPDEEEKPRTLPAPAGEEKPRTLPAPADSGTGKAERKGPLRSLLGGLPLDPKKAINLPTGRLSGSLQTGDLLD